MEGPACVLGTGLYCPLLAGLEGCSSSRGVQQPGSSIQVMELRCAWEDRAWDFVVGDTNVSLRYLWSSNVCHTCRLFRVSGAQRARAGLAGNSGKKGFPLMMGPNRSLVFNSWLCRCGWPVVGGGCAARGRGGSAEGGDSQPRPRGAAALCPVSQGLKLQGHVSPSLVFWGVL